MVYYKHRQGCYQRRNGGEGRRRPRSVRGGRNNNIGEGGRPQRGPGYDNNGRGGHIPRFRGRGAGRGVVRGGGHGGGPGYVDYQRPEGTVYNAEGQNPYNMAPNGGNNPNDGNGGNGGNGGNLRNYGLGN